MRLGIGYSLSPKLSFELGYIDFGEAQVKGSSNSVSNYDNATYEATAILVDMVSSLPLTDNLSVTGHLGATLWSWDFTRKFDASGTAVSVADDDNGVSILFGFGLLYELAENFDVEGGFTRYDIDDAVINDFSASINYRF